MFPRLIEFVDTLQRLADTKENQIAYLVELGTSPSTDELAIEFSDHYQLLKAGLSEGLVVLDEKVLKQLHSIDSLLDAMSNANNDAIWDISSLEGYEWTRVRESAQEALALIV